MGVALLVDGPLGVEVDALRLAVGDGSLARIAAHLTLVPPVNVGAGDLSRALAVLRQAAAILNGPLSLSLGPPATFLPLNPVLYLPAVEQGQDDALRRLRDAVFAAPLERSLSWPWVPHVTLADEATPERLAAAVIALADFRRPWKPDRLTLLERRQQGWAPLADVRFGAPVVVDRGGLRLELSEGTVLDPQARALMAGVAADGSNSGGPGEAASWLSPPENAETLVLTARGAVGDSEVSRKDSGVSRKDSGASRKDAEVVGVAMAWWPARRWPGDSSPTGWSGHLRPGAAVATVVVHPAHRRRGVGRWLLAALEARVEELGWPPEWLGAIGPIGFYEANSARVRPARGEQSAR